MDLKDLFNEKYYPSDEALEEAEEDGRTYLFDEEMNAAKKLNERVNADIARIDEMLENSNYSPEENAEKRGIK